MWIRNLFARRQILNKKDDKDSYHPVVVPPAEADLIPHPLMNHLGKKIVRNLVLLSHLKQ
jgi:hypothetical protein